MVEVDLCGHATLATAHVLFQERGFSGDEIAFETRSGILRVKKMPAGRLSMDFPLRPWHPVETPPLMEKALGQKPFAVLAGDDYVVLFRDEAQIRVIHPDMTVLQRLDLRGVAITAPGKDCDFVARFFGAESRGSRRPGYRLGLHGTCPVLGRKTGENQAPRAAGFSAWR